MSNSFRTSEGRRIYKDLLAEEEMLVGRRRAVSGTPGEQQRAGLALSGGGIRSATFCLGVLQALSDRGVISRFDYLSTVSGGSYIGSFFGALYVPASIRAATDATDKAPAFYPTDPLGSPLGLEAVRRLRDCGRYLTPAGTSDAFFGASIVLRNWAAVHVLIGLTALLILWLIRIGDMLLTSVAGFMPMESQFSPALFLSAWIAAMFVFGFSAAYWLTRRDFIPVSRLKRIYTNLYFWTALLVGIAAIMHARPVIDTFVWVDLRWPTLLSIHAAATVTIALVSFAYAEWTVGSVKKMAGDERSAQASVPDRQLLIAAEDKVRTRLSGWLSTALTAFLAVIAVLVVDWLGSLLQQRLLTLELPSGGSWPSQLWELTTGAWPVLIAAVPPVASLMTRLGMKRRQQAAADGAAGAKPADRLPTLILVTGILVVFCWGILWSAFSHGLLGHLDRDPYDVVVTLGILVAVNLAQSLCFSFINLSSLSTFYAARLRRAYIGASSYGRKFRSVRQDDPEDTIRIRDYYSGIESQGAPLHLINVTIAETMAGTSSLVARDRKGKPMQLTPCGIVFEGDIPGKFEAGLIETGEELPLANWIAISGAAVSAAIGSGTSLGTSILATLANVRLGYWWQARHSDGWRDFLWHGWHDFVQNYLFLELRGAFAGTRRDRWYLTDGGHFENTAVYSLLQRKVPFIFACDNGADPGYDMVDVMRLVQRARIDLGADIRFLDQAELEDKVGEHSPLLELIGSYQALARAGDINKPGGPVATLASIRYANGETGTLLLLKPRLTFTEPPDMLAYYRRPGCRSFPQQTTGDQYFDEEQWEAYRRLGEYYAARLFMAPDRSSGSWYPHDMKP